MVGYEVPSMNQSRMTYGSVDVPVPLRTPFVAVKSRFEMIAIGPCVCNVEGSVRPYPGGAPPPVPCRPMTRTPCLCIALNPDESWMSNFTMYVPGLGKACS